MSNFDYSKSVIIANRLITKFGQSMTLRVITEGEYDPETGGTANTSVDNEVIGVIFDINSSQAGQKLQNRTLVEATDKKCLLKVGVAPNLLDKLIVNSNTFIIINIKNLNPGGTVIFYDLVLRSG